MTGSDITRLVEEPVPVPAPAVEAVRRALGPVGVFLPIPTDVAPPVDLQREAVQRLERAGYRAAWTNEVIGKDALTQLAVLLAATETLVLGTGIANIWARPPQTAHAAAALLEQAYPGRLVLGLGVGYPEQATAVGREFGSPLATLRSYLAAMAVPGQLPAPEVTYPTVVGAHGPKMLALAREMSDGAMPALVAPDATARARQVLGPDKLLAVLVHASTGDGDTDGDATAAVVAAHVAAGADHVVVGQPIGTDFAAGVDHLERLAPALTP